MFGGELIFRRAGLCLLELKLQLVEQPRRALGARSVNRAPQLFDLKIDDARISAPRPCASSATAATAHALLRRSFWSAPQSAPLFQRVDVVRKLRGKIGVHSNHMESQNRPFERALFLRFFSRFSPIRPPSDAVMSPCGMRQSMPDSR